jgi:hemerythrin
MVSAIEWEDTLRVGLITPHKHILDLISRLTPTLADLACDVARRQFLELRAAFVTHFDYEERLMPEAAAAHRRAHSTVLAEIDDAIARIDEATAIGADLLDHNFDAALIDEIVRHDADLVGELVHAGKVGPDCRLTTGHPFAGE